MEQVSIRVSDARYRYESIYSQNIDSEYIIILLLTDTYGQAYIQCERLSFEADKRRQKILFTPASEDTVNESMTSSSYIPHPTSKTVGPSMGLTLPPSNDCLPVALPASSSRASSSSAIVPTQDNCNQTIAVTFAASMLYIHLGILKP